MKIKKLGLILVSLVIFSFMIVGVQATGPGDCLLSFDGHDRANNCRCNNGGTNLWMTTGTFTQCVDICSVQFVCQWYTIHHAWGPGNDPDQWNWPMMSGQWSRAELNVIFWGLFAYDKYILGDGLENPEP